MSDETNTKPLSMRRIKALKALCKKATPAPWEDKREPSLTEDGEELRRYYHIESKKGTICELFYNEDWEAMGCYDNDAVDAAFIAAARQAVPDLLAEVERLRAENKRLEKAANWLANMLEYHVDGCCPLRFAIENDESIPKIDGCKGTYLGEDTNDPFECRYDENVRVSKLNCWVEAAVKATSEDGNHE